MYKIIFNMSAPMVYYDLPIFDGIIAYCKYKEQMKLSDFHTPHGSEIIDFELPFIKHDLGFYLASYLCFDNIIEGEDAWRKQWESRYDEVVDFGKTRKRINVGSGQFKSYDIPIVTNYARKVWFYFDGDPNEIEKLIAGNIAGFGKKSSIGYGFYSSFGIERSDNQKMLYYRPVLPELLPQMQGFKLIIRAGRIKPPYWLPSNQKVLIPNL
jgi:hypothetical protein